ncbi:LysM peptidoglycan-binding domain-containing protein [Staphylococcus simulans]
MKKLLVASTAVTAAAAVLATGFGTQDVQAKSSSKAEHAKKVKEAEKYLNEKGEYTVVKGDTLNKIAKKFDVKVKELKKWNDKESDLILVDESLKVKEPKKVATTQTASQSNGNYAYNTQQVSYSNYNQAQSYNEPQSSYTAPQQSYEAPQASYSAPSYASYGSGSVRLANGNTAGATGSYAAAQMEARTGVSASVWENIIARESNGQVNAYNPSGARGLFQTMPGHGSTATVQDQINSAVHAYNVQGLGAWGY